jgi:hypothetical protein
VGKACVRNNHCQPIRDDDARHDIQQPLAPFSDHRMPPLLGSPGLVECDADALGFVAQDKTEKPASGFGAF